MLPPTHSSSLLGCDSGLGGADLQGPVHRTRGHVAAEEELGEPAGGSLLPGESRGEPWRRGAFLSLKCWGGGVVGG